MSKGVKVSPKHGLNPTIPLCFWCGKPKNEVALVGKLKGDREAPHNMVLDFEPCEECKKEWDKGVAIMEVTDRQPVEGMPQIFKDKKVWFTGRMVVLKPDALKPPYNVAGKKAFMTVESYTKMFGNK